jgi:hypothetical protein
MDLTGASNDDEESYAPPPEEGEKVEEGEEGEEATCYCRKFQQGQVGRCSGCELLHLPTTTNAQCGRQAAQEDLRISGDNTTIVHFIFSVSQLYIVNCPLFNVG